MSRTAGFKVDGIDGITPVKDDRYLCNPIVQIQYVTHEQKDDDVKYYSQIQLTDCYCSIIKNNRKINSILKPKKFNSILKLKNNKHKSKSKNNKHKSEDFA